ncbi:MAG: hypothetical protein HY904_13835 [Deltaproteobacteria bacterium]|nr:hypothetical protein [Deltaproteobacteria bacterium]
MLISLLSLLIAAPQESAVAVAPARGTMPQAARGQLDDAAVAAARSAVSGSRMKVVAPEELGVFSTAMGQDAACRDTSCDADVAKQAGVSLLLQTEAMSVGDTAYITIQLVELGTQKVLASETIQRPVSDPGAGLAAVYRKVAGSITRSSAFLSAEPPARAQGVVVASLVRDGAGQAWQVGRLTKPTRLDPYADVLLQRTTKALGRRGLGPPKPPGDSITERLLKHDGSLDENVARELLRSSTALELLVVVVDLRMGLPGGATAATADIRVDRFAFRTGLVASRKKAMRYACTETLQSDSCEAHTFNAAADLAAEVMASGK